MKSILTLFPRPVTIGVIGLLTTLVLYNVITLFSESEDLITEEVTARVVTLQPIGALRTTSNQRFVGTVAAVNQANLQAEAGGRVVAVPVTIGSRVTVGQVIAQFENAAQRAALIQAEGAYEAAVASTNQGISRNESTIRNAEIAVTNAENAFVQTIQNSYNTANSALVSTIDQFYSDPLGLSPGVRISRTDVRYVRAERVAFQKIMAEWRTEAQLTTFSNDSERYLTASLERIERLTLLVDHLILATNRAQSSDVLNNRPVSEYTPLLIAERDQLVATAQSLRSAASGLAQARESLLQTRSQDIGGDSALSEAQVKQALGSLQAAQANLAKTILRSPIAGTVNNLQVSVGDFIGVGTPVAEIVNEGAYEVSIFVTENERARLTVGDSVVVNGQHPGTIAHIAPALDARTQKIEVMVSIESTTVIAGSTVTVSLSSEAGSEINQVLKVPITAIAFTIAEGTVLTVVDNQVVALPVILGAVQGNQIEISGDIESTTEIIVDARGLVVGEAVTIK